ncbi:hypothetical protein GI405_22300 [Salmonella enterica]|nr:hypothetical protein [Salmonella enterica]
MLNHGAMNANEVNGHRAATYATIACDKPALVRLRVIESSLALGNGIRSDLFIDGAPTDATSSTVQYSLNSPRTIEVASVLSAMNPQSGTFSGSSYVIVELL